MELHKKLSMNCARVAGVSRNAQRHRSRSINVTRNRVAFLLLLVTPPTHQGNQAE